MDLLHLGSAKTFMKALGVAHAVHEELSKVHKGAHGLWVLLRCVVTPHCYALRVPASHRRGTAMHCPVLRQSHCTIGTAPIALQPLPCDCTLTSSCRVATHNKINPKDFIPGLKTPGIRTFRNYCHWLFYWVGYVKFREKLSA